MFEWLKETVAIVVIGSGLAITSIEKMLTENYQPWKGDSLSSLNVVRGEPHSPARMQYDSPEIRSLLSASRNGAELKVELQKRAYFEVTPGTKCKVIRQTGLRCLGDTYTSSFVVVHISSGPNRGKQGMIRDSELARTVGMP